MTARLTYRAKTDFHFNIIKILIPATKNADILTLILEIKIMTAGAITQS